MRAFTLQSAKKNPSIWIFTFTMTLKISDEIYIWVNGASDLVERQPEMKDVAEYIYITSDSGSNPFLFRIAEHMEDASWKRNARMIPMHLGCGTRRTHKNWIFNNLYRCATRDESLLYRQLRNIFQLIVIDRISSSLHMSDMIRSMGMFPMVERKNSSSIVLELTPLREGSSSSSFPNRNGWVG